MSLRDIPLADEDLDTLRQVVSDAIAAHEVEECPACGYLLLPRDLAELDADIDRDEAGR